MKEVPSDPQHRRESEILPEAPRPFPEAAGRPAADQRLRYHGDMLGHIETGYRSTSIFEIDKLAEALKVDYNACLPRINARYGEISAPCRFASGHPLSRATV